MDNIAPGDKLFYTTGRLTSEMVIKTVLMGISGWYRGLALQKQRFALPARQA